MREKRGVPGAPFYTNAGEKNTKDGDARSAQPLKIQHSQRTGPVAVCSVTSRPPLPLVGGPVERTLTLERTTGWWFVFLR